MNINWLTIAFHFIWVLGLALLLATLSYTHWWAEQQATPFRQALSQPSAMQLINASLSLISLSLALLAMPWWESLLWGGFMLVFLWQLWQSKPQRSE